MDTSGKSLVEFWGWAGDKGLVNTNTATAKRVACTQVLGAMDNWEDLDVSGIDVDEAFRRFTNKRSKDFTPASLGTYKSRFTQALADFLAYQKNPESWKPSRERTVTVREDKPSATEASRNGKSETRQDALPTRAGLIEYPFPLREGRFAYLHLPADLKAVDVKRLTGFLNTLADDGETAA